MKNIVSLPKTPFEAGKGIRADYLNRVAKMARRGNMVHGMFVNGEFMLQHGRRGGGGNTSNVIAMAQVVSPASANGGSIGTCVLLSEEDLTPVNAAGEALIMDPLDSGYSEYEIEQAALEFKSAHTDSGMKAGDRIWLMSSDSIAEGTSWYASRVWALHVDSSCYWEGHASFANNRYLGAAGDQAVYRAFEVGNFEDGFDGTAICESGTIVITIEPSGSGVQFIIPPSGGESS